MIEQNRSVCGWLYIYITSDHFIWLEHKQESDSHQVPLSLSIYTLNLYIYIYIYIYIYNYIICKWRNWCYLRITMTRKSSKYLHATYGALNSCFDLIRSHQQCTPWSPPLEIEPTTTVCRSWNSTSGPLVHTTYKRCRINKSWWIARPLWPIYIYQPPPYK